MMQLGRQTVVLIGKVKYNERTKIIRTLSGFTASYRVTASWFTFLSIFFPTQAGTKGLWIPQEITCSY
jgi:hypothetical protein